jgi:hypothetical protein
MLRKERSPAQQLEHRARGAVAKLREAFVLSQHANATVSLNRPHLQPSAGHFEKTATQSLAS